MIVVEGGSRAAAPKGSMTYAFTYGEIFPPPPPPPPPPYPPPPRSRHTLNRPQGHRCCHPQTCHDYELYEIIFYRENGGIPVKEFLHQLHGGVVLVDQVLPVVVPVLRELATHATVDNL